MSRKHFIKGTLLLSVTGLLTRFIGFFYRIFLSHTIGAEGLGIFQLIVPLQTLILSVTTVGIQMAISRLCAARFALKKDQDACDYFTLGTILSVTFTVILSFFLYTYADFFAIQILKESRTEGLLRILAFSLPLSALHTCISSFYFSRKDTRLPSLLQLMEQIVRTGCTYLLYRILLSEGKEITALIAIGGSLAGEIFSALFGSLILGIHFYGRKYRLFPVQKIRFRTRQLCSMAVPLSLSRILVTLLSSIEVVFIPQQLRKFGLDTSESLRIYGIFTGMALPLILFPSTITNSVAVMLMPSIAELQALGQKAKIRSVTITVCRLTFLLGGACCLSFLSFGSFLGAKMYHSNLAGDYIRSMSFLCPFLYLHTMLASILHGLGRSGICLIHNLAGSYIRLLFVIFSIPILGIRGYLYGLLVSELMLTLLHLFDLQNVLHDAI